MKTTDCVACPAQGAETRGNKKVDTMIKVLRRAALLLGVLMVGACASAPPPPANFAAPAPRHPDAKTTLENHY